ncbi:thiol:disulfide interchange protein DsbG [Lysobacter sp. N42]|jgi:thiol:disulfide interchange protein DsbG|uniref:thiol:disulfide interchange protein DsbG n=1 Tax=Lysobacter sp. N42 TaxID=2545719 RepID=UPI00104CD25B|nr:thiol:disulfide interchange protein DsbG [Lysobacter sp. N42]TCZ83360.1 thiol:disulfide interchange protein DsbG [Lysobacter sp. N42]
MKPFNPSVLVLALALAGTAACSRAGEPPAAPGTPRPPVVRAIEAQGLEVFGEFAAPGGLRGFAGLAGQRPMAIYVTPDGGHAVIGMLVDAKGQDVGQAELERLVAAPVSKRVWAQLEASHWVRDGRPDAPRVVYAFSDPNCPYCNRFWRAARPWVDSGKVQLRHILVGVIRDDSANKAAAILTAAAPSEALARNETTYATGGITGAPTVTAAIRAQLDANERLMLELGFQGTPGILFRDDKGLVQRRSGLPAEADLPVVLGAR